MSAVPTNVVDFKIPKKKPRVIEKQALPDQRKFAVVPMPALSDERLHHLSIRVLALICSYANKAGITWVGQARIADHLNISKQAVNKAVKQLKEAGYLEVMSKGFRGERADTMRIIYDPSIKAEDAIAITSSEEDTRPPHMATKETREALNADGLPEMSDEQIQANRKRLRELLGTLGKPSNFRTHQPQPIGEIMPRKPASKKQPIVNPQVDNQEGLHSQPHSQPKVNLQVDQTQKSSGIEVYIRLLKEKGFKCLVNQVEVELLSQCMSAEEAAEALELVASRYHAEGLHLPASLPVVVEDMIATHAARHLAGSQRG